MPAHVPKVIVVHPPTRSSSDEVTRPRPPTGQEVKSPVGRSVVSTWSGEDENKTCSIPKPPLPMVFD
ncbi:hypothetical protein SK128_012757 [Halocaridina rubra]|uniref:Uncharacterized protein n=1 Tax=Halocaridina rubra TaxID=373956 RepID=A0AAN8X0Y0_HALRR